MQNFKLLLLFLSLFFGVQSLAAIYYVGDDEGGANTCDQPNHYDNLDLAILAAAFNGPEADEIRLTNTVNYTGSLSGSYQLDGWNSLEKGNLSIIGGFANCNSTGSSGITVIGIDTDSVFEIIGDSTVTFRNISMTGSESRGLIVDQESEVYLESVDISDNVAGIRVLGGSYVSIDANSVVFGNGDINDIPKGGGIWCFGNNSAVRFAGVLTRNKAQQGGNLFIENGCFVELVGGSNISGSRAVSQKDAESGGGIMVFNGGELFSNGGANRVLITDHWADFGGGIYVWGTGRATILNTYIARNRAFEKGSGLYAINGGLGANQITMDRAASCPFLISCSEFEGNEYSNYGVVFVQNSQVQISRTIFEGNIFSPAINQIAGLVHTTSDAVVRISHLNMLNNEAENLLVNFGDMEVAHLTAIGNEYDEDDIGTGDSFAWGNLGDLRLENSIWQDTQGGDNRGGNVSGKCNLIDVIGEWPNGTYTIGTADFINPAGGDARQISSSDGVDMCTADTFAWNTDRDIEYQISPVNENTNPQGSPGEPGGLYDAGFDEVYDNIGPDEFLLTVQKEGSGSGTVVSTPVGISCGTDCTEVYFNGTVVTLFPNASPGSEFIGWRGCPLVNPSGQCQAAITESELIFAEFQPDDLIFSDGFD